MQNFKLKSEYGDILREQIKGMDGGKTKGANFQALGERLGANPSQMTPFTALLGGVTKGLGVGMQNKAAKTKDEKLKALEEYEAERAQWVDTVNQDEQRRQVLKQKVEDNQEVYDLMITTAEQMDGEGASRFLNNKVSNDETFSEVMTYSTGLEGLSFSKNDDGTYTVTGKDTETGEAGSVKINLASLVQAKENRAMIDQIQQKAIDKSKRQMFVGQLPTEDGSAAVQRVAYVGNDGKYYDVDTDEPMSGFMPMRLHSSAASKQEVASALGTGLGGVQLADGSTVVGSKMITPDGQEIHIDDAKALEGQAGGTLAEESVGAAQKNLEAKGKYAGVTASAQLMEPLTNIFIEPDGSLNRASIASVNSENGAVDFISGLINEDSVDAFGRAYSAMTGMLRLESGAAVPIEEMKNFLKAYIPQQWINATPYTAASALARLQDKMDVVGEALRTAEGRIKAEMQKNGTFTPESFKARMEQEIVNRMDSLRSQEPQVPLRANAVDALRQAEKTGGLDRDLRDRLSIGIIRGKVPIFSTIAEASAFYQENTDRLGEEFYTQESGWMGGNIQ